MWVCRFCGKVYYWVNQTACLCPGELAFNASCARAKFYGEPEPKPPEWEFKWKEIPMSNESEVGVIVGRFQTPYLHEGHMEVIKKVAEAHPRVFVFLGQTPLKCTRHDPLDYNARELMINQAFPDVEVHKINDVGDNDLWSMALDKEIDLLTGVDQKVTLYGGRGSFITTYTGRYHTEELAPSRYLSASEIRAKCGIKSKGTQEWREGVIWALQNKWPTVYTTVDMAPISADGNQVLLVRKPYERKFRFAGGFADVKSQTFEDDAKRELFEETDLEGEMVQYIGSTLIDDWRYRDQVDKIKTLFWLIPLWTGTPKPSDDIKGGDVRWFPIDAALMDEMVDTHHPLLTMLCDFRNKQSLKVQKITETKLTTIPDLGKV